MQANSPLHSPLHSNLRLSKTSDKVQTHINRTTGNKSRRNDEASCYKEDDDDTERLLDADAADFDVDDSSLRRSDSMESVSSVATVDNFERSLVSKIAERFALGTIVLCYFRRSSSFFLRL